MPSAEGPASQSNEIRLRRIARRISERRGVYWVYRSESTDDRVHGLRGITPYLMLHGIRMAQAAHLPSFPPVIRFSQDPESLLGLSMQIPEPLSPYAWGILAVLQDRALQDIQITLDTLERENPKAWGRSLIREGGHTLIEATRMARLAHVFYGSDLSLDDLVSPPVETPTPAWPSSRTSEDTGPAQPPSWKSPVLGF